MTAEFAFDLAPDALVVLVGASGSGKTTLCRRWPATARLSLDSYRAMATDSAADQSATTTAVQVQDLLLDARLSRGLFTVIDSTGLQQHVRAHLLARARYWRRPAYAVLLQVPLNLCLRRNANRARVVPVDVVAGQYRQVPTGQQLLGEGFTAVDVVTAPRLGLPRPR
ncbi:AAA family ATPase [Kitasatospora griseola]|uniref:AAA family ATPase n=1 Tax=Kitasatospora griseola TaxID=2064 RepID=UPI00381F0102